jgi:hypothetical protein
MLHIHGFLSDAESERVKRRIGKWLKGSESPKKARHKV